MSTKSLSILCLALWLATCASDAVDAAEVSVCFTPEEDCAAFIVRELEQVDTTLRVQAYGFTHSGILGAIVAVKKQGRLVEVILDESNESVRYSGATFMANHQIPTYIDFLPAIAHSKVMIIDDDTIITGSFNFTKSAATRNVENVIVISGDRVLVGRYREHFESRKRVSRPYVPPQSE